LNTMLTQMLVMAAGLVAAAPACATDNRTGEPPRGWIMELHGYAYHRNAIPKARWIIDVHWPQAQAAPQIEPIEAQYYDDLRPVFEQLKKQKP
jgi:hypothetical protein